METLWHSQLILQTPMASICLFLPSVDKSMHTEYIMPISPAVINGRIRKHPHKLFGVSCGCAPSCNMVQGTVDLRALLEHRGQPELVAMTEHLATGATTALKVRRALRF